MLNWLWHRDDDTGHLSLPPGIETNRDVTENMDWEGDVFPPDPKHSQALFPGELARQRFLQLFQRDMASFK